MRPWNQTRHFVTFSIRVPMNEEGSHASFATLETRLVSAGKVGVKVLLQSGHNLDNSSSYKKKHLHRWLNRYRCLKQCIWTDTLVQQTSLKSGLGEVTNFAVFKDHTFADAPCSSVVPSQETKVLLLFIGPTTRKR